MSEGFAFLDPGPLIDGELSLVLVNTNPGDPVKRWVPWYNFEMRLAAAPNVKVGHVNLRAQTNYHVELYAGHIGYSVDPPFRGNRYAERGARLIFPLARRHGFETLWITCNPDNVASRRTCERLGGEMVEIVPVPETEEMHKRGDRFKCRYRIELRR